MRPPPSRTMLIPLLLWAGLALGIGAPTERVRQDSDPQTGSEHWLVSRGGVTLELVSRRPEQVQAFYLGRGFPPDLARRMAGYCTISVGLRNDGPDPIHYDLSRWRYVTEDGVVRNPKAKEDWMREWKARGIRFGFSQLSRSQTFEPGDWNAAMVSFEVPHGARFDLHYQWETPHGEVTGTLEEVHCASDES